MEKTTHIELSDYQRAILNEMGVSSWRLADGEPTTSKVENSNFEVVAPTSQASVSKEDALTKLKQLKVQTQATEVTDSVLVTFSQNDTSLQIFADVLIALGLEAKQQKHISSEQLNHFSGYPLSWTQGEKVSMRDNQLTTPSLVELNNSDTKKQLWQQLQSAFSVTQD
jgi:DNA polymerase III psi subunit